MNADEWQTCLDPVAMLNALPTLLATVRKLRLFVCACARHFEELIPEGAARTALAIAEQAADGAVPPKEVSYHAVEMGKALGVGQMINHSVRWLLVFSLQAQSSRAQALRSARSAVWYAVSAGAQLVHPSLLGPNWRTDPQYDHLRRIPCDVLRELFGNPFCTVETPRRWPITIQGLARSLYDGENCVFALHDALLDAGLTELAEHFTTSHHPKGCWVVDRILKKR